MFVHRISLKILRVRWVFTKVSRGHSVGCCNNWFFIYLCKSVSSSNDRIFNVQNGMVQFILISQKTEEFVVSHAQRSLECKIKGTQIIMDPQ